VFAVRFFTNLAIPGWATSTAGLIAVILIQLLGVSFSLVFSLIVGRMSTTFIPFKEYSAFVDKLDSLTEQ
jgi:hypothetical protein